MKSVKINVDLQSESVEFASDRALSLTQQLRLLRQELQKVPAGTKEFDLLAEKMNDTDDAIKKVNVQSRDFFAALGTFPGLLGTVGRSVDGVVDAFKIFGDLKLDQLKTQLNASLGDFKGIVSTIGRLTGITKTYTVINNALAASFVKVGVGETAAAAGARAFAAALTATGVGAIVVGLGLLIANFNKVKEVVFDLIPGLKSVGEFFGNIVNAVTDFIGVTSQAERDVEALTVTIGLQNEALENEIAVLEASGASTEEVYAKKEQIYRNELKVLEETFKAKGKLTDEELKQQRTLVNNLTILDAKRTKDRADAADKAAKDAEKAAKDRLDKELFLIETQTKETLQGLEKVRNEILGEEDVTERQRIKLLQDYEAMRLQIIADGIQDRRDQFEIGSKEYIQADLELQQADIEIRKNQIESNKELNEIDDSLLEAKLERFRAERDAIIENNRFQLSQLRIYSEEVGDTQEMVFAKQLALEKVFAENQFEERQLARDKERDALKASLEDSIINEQEYLTRIKSLNAEQIQDEEFLFATLSQLSVAEGNFNQEIKDQILANNLAIAASYTTMAGSIGDAFAAIADISKEGSEQQKTLAKIAVYINSAVALADIFFKAKESFASYARAGAAGTASILQGTALLGNPVTAAIGASMIASGKAAVAGAKIGKAATIVSSVAQAAAVAAQASAQISAINSGSPSSAASGGGAGEAATPTFSQTTGAAAPVIAASTANPQGELAGIVAGAITANNSQSRPIQAYVVGDQVSTQQQLDRRIALAAKMAG
jgi:CII-binding regulator of phage lambda lysogenization HflD